MHQIGYMSERPKWLLAEDVVSTNLSSWASNSRCEQLRGDVFYVVYGQNTLWKLAKRHGANRTWIPRLKLRTRLPRLIRDLTYGVVNSRIICWCSFDHGTRSVKEKGTEHLGGNSWIFKCIFWKRTSIFTCRHYLNGHRSILRPQNLPNKTSNFAKRS